jgi:type III pantothenate kinase
MLLTIDVGNSTIVIGVFDGSELADHWRIATEPHRTPDEIALALDGLLAFAGLDLRRDLTGVAIASVVPPVTEDLRAMAERYLAVPPIVVEPGVRTGIPMKVDNPRDIGADRIVNAVAAAEMYGAPSIVVDFGTATSFDAVDRDGAFVGGAIAPGVRVSADALADHAARLPRVEIVRPDHVVARSTVTALQSGIVYGFAGQVDTLVRRLSAELGPGVTTVATGGMAPSVLDTCETIDVHDPWLTLKGLRLIWERNAR